MPMAIDTTRQHRITPGYFYMVLMPHSECAVHMGIAGTAVQVFACEDGVRLADRGRTDGPWMTDGEAGIYSRPDGSRWTYGMRFADAVTG